MSFVKWNILADRWIIKKDDDEFKRSNEASSALGVRTTGKLT